MEYRASDILGKKQPASIAGRINAGGAHLMRNNSRHQLQSGIIAGAPH
jgi:hypothetical protein